MFTFNITKLLNHINKNIIGLYNVGKMRRNEDVRNIKCIEFITKKDLQYYLREFMSLYKFDAFVDIKTYKNNKLVILININGHNVYIKLYRIMDNLEYKIYKWLTSLHISVYKECIKEQKKRGYILSYKGLYNIENKYYMNFNTKKDFVKILYLKK